MLKIQHYAVQCDIQLIKSLLAENKDISKLNFEKIINDLLGGKNGTTRNT